MVTIQGKNDFFKRAKEENAELVYIFDEVMVDHDDGMAVLVAESYEEALKILTNHYYQDWDYENDNLESYTEIPILGGYKKGVVPLSRGSM